ncbi:hypothetical protein IFM89_002109 [Coptis chinensis]|uniref:Uncharacterized protein n=1 Tax=Coptis chinensis TaxID=261450 RepID=A0A835H2P4_9MAGN|nr:hypothetical protein IFM89_002109 [Coptis chinensis]
MGVNGCVKFGSHIRNLDYGLGHTLHLKWRPELRHWRLEGSLRCSISLIQLGYYRAPSHPQNKKEILLSAGYKNTNHLGYEPSGNSLSLGTKSHLDLCEIGSQRGHQRNPTIPTNL